MSATDDLAVKFRPLRDHATIVANRKLLRAAADEANATLRLVSALAVTNRSLCDHKGARSYTDRGGGISLDCPHCGGD